MKNRFTLMLSLALATFLFSCSESKPTEDLARAFFETYEERSDSDKFMSYFAEDVVLEDIMNGDKIEGKVALKKFFDWDNPNYSKAREKALIVEDLIVQGNKAMARGVFTGFKWQGYAFDPMHFSIILEFNDAGKIVKEIDWINYPANLIDYTARKNSNEWIQLENAE